MKKLIILTVVFGIYSFPMSGAEFSYDTLMSNFQDYVTGVYTCGHWENHESEGYYRVIHVDFLLGSSWLYVQWMKGLCCDGKTEAFHTLSLYDNDHHENTFGKPSCTETSNGIVLNYVAKNGHNDQTFRIELSIFHPFGKHLIKKTLVPENQ